MNASTKLGVALIGGGLRAWGEKMALATVPEAVLVGCLQEFIVAQELELARIVASELLRREPKEHVCS